MSKTRMLNTKFWTDGYVMNLDPIEKLVYNYLITNPYTEICGIYELSLKIAAVELGIEKDMIEKVLKRFEADKKVMYRDGWVAIKNFIKNQSKNPKVEIGIKVGLKKAPKELRKFVKGIAYQSLSHSDIDTDTDLDSDLDSNSKVISAGAEVNKVIDLFKAVNPSWENLFKRKHERDAAAKLLETYGMEKLASMIEYLTYSNAQQYAPVITTPRELEEKMGKIIAWVQKNKASKSSVAFV